MNVSPLSDYKCFSEKDLLASLVDSRLRNCQLIIFCPGFRKDVFGPQSSQGHLMKILPKTALHSFIHSSLFIYLQKVFYGGFFCFCILTCTNNTKSYMKTTVSYTMAILSHSQNTLHLKCNSVDLTVENSIIR